MRDIVVTLDTDGSTDPCEIPAFADTFVKGVDFTKGSRYATGGGSVDLTRLHSAGNWDLNVLSNPSLGTEFIDSCCNYSVLQKDIVSALRLPDLDPPQSADGGRLWSDGLKVETLITVRVAQTGLATIEAPSFELDRIYGESNLCTFANGRRVPYTIATEMACHNRVKRARLVATPARHHLPTYRLRLREQEHLNV